MKTHTILTSAFIIIVAGLMIFQSGCEKDDNEAVSLPSTTSGPMAWAVGNQDSTSHGMILFSADSGNTWVRQGENSPALQNSNIQNLFVENLQNVWVVCDNNTIARTTDGGNSWNKVNSPQVDADAIFMCISIADNGDVWISGSGQTTGLVCKSTDEGASWVVFDTNFFQGYQIQGIRAINDQLVYAVGNHTNLGGFIARTSDGGTNWESVTLDDNYNIHGWIDVAAKNENHIVIYGSHGHYAHTENGGTTWANDSVNVGIGGPDINHLIMLDEINWWAACDYDNIHRTTDAGQNWSSQQSNGPANMFLVGIDAYDDELALIVGESAGWQQSGKILQTSDGGNTWVLKQTTGVNLVKVAFAPH